MKHHLTRRRRHFRPQRLRSNTYRPGSTPGSLEPLTLPHDEAQEEQATPAQIHFLRYGPAGVLDEATDTDIQRCKPSNDGSDSVTWIHLQGRPTAAQLQALGSAFDLHPLALEDVMHHETRPKLESFEHHQFMVLKRLWNNDNANANGDESEHADEVIGSALTSFFLGRNFLISMDEGPSDLFESIRQRIHGTGKIHARKADYLLYALTDAVVDSGFPVLEALGDALETLEEEILDTPSQETRNKIHFAKRELMQMRHAWWPQREVVAALMRDDKHVLSDDTRLYLRDCYEHSVILIDFVETYRELAANLLDVYLSAVSQRMNDIMRALTIAATIFLPLMFITGIYGMNFDTDSPWNMPELAWKYGYLTVLIAMLVLVGGMLTYFKRKRWM